MFADMNYQYIASGVKTDCQKLLEKFTATGSVRFKEFVQIWKDMKFSCIYCGRESFAELYEFIEEVLKIAKDFFLPPNPLQTRLCGLYLLYGLYYKQPTVEGKDYLVKIRLNLKEWEDSNSLMDTVREERHYDALFIFSKLVAENAFHFCTMSREYGLEKSIRKYMERGSTSAEDPSPKSEVSILEESGLLNALDELSKKYYEIKCALNSESRKKKPPDVLNYANQHITDDIKKLLATVGGAFKSDEEVEVGGIQESIGSHRRMLKDKACYGAGPSTAT